MKRTLLVTALLVVATVPAVAAASNEPPLPDAGLDQRVDQGDVVLLDATGSRDPDGNVTRYVWEIEAPNGTAFAPNCATCGRTRFRVTRPGRYEATVRVVDDDGAERTDTLYVYVSGERSSDGSQPQGSSPSTDRGAPSSGSQPTSAGSDGSPGDGAAEPVPTVDIRGPSTLSTGEVGTYQASTSGFTDPKRFGWTPASEGATTELSWHSPGMKTIYVSVSGANGESGLASKTVRVVDNKPPSVRIQDPGSFSPGETLSLTADSHDPDGTIVRTRWTPRNGEITVPTDGSNVMVSVTVIDDDGATATDRAVLSVEGLQPKEETPNIAKVYCYYTQDWQRNRGSPEHCEVGGATGDGPRGDGYAAGPTYKNWVRSDHYRVVWKPATRKQLRNPEGKNMTSDLGEGNFKTAPDPYPYNPTGATDALKEALYGPKPSSNYNNDKVTIDGQTVYADLTGDGQVDAADWSVRYGSDGEQSKKDEVTESIRDAKDVIGGRPSIGGGGGGGGSDHDSGNSNSGGDNSSDNSNSSSGNSSGGDDSSPYGGGGSTGDNIPSSNVPRI